jgi:CubicO group peptidase (beta-lactamase class C family)
MNTRLRAALLGFTILAAGCTSAPPRPAPVARDDIEAVRRQLDSFIQHEMAQHKLAGLSIALVDDQQIVWAQGFGWADAESTAPAKPETRYRVGSITKLFTATAAMQLVADGRLDLDAPVQRSLPWFGMRTAWPDEGPITLRQLMSHRAGLPRDVNGGQWLKEAPPLSRDFRAVLRALGDTDVDAPPGLMIGYSNVGLDVVGAMVEAAAGEPFEQRLQQSVLAPLGMRDASFSAAVPTDAGMARAHFKGEAQREPALRDVPAGGLNASVIDLAYFLMMQFADGRNRAGEVVLPAAQQAQMLQPQYPGLALDVDTRVGLGWMLSTSGADSVRSGGPVAHHGGATMYFRSALVMLPQYKLGVAVLSNDGAAGDVASAIAQRALALLLEARTGIRQAAYTPGFVPAAQPWTPEQWQALRTACVGDYMTLVGPVSLFPDGQALGVRAGERHLEVRAGEEGRFGVRYRLAGALPIQLGLLSEIGLECRQLAGRQVLLAVFDGERSLAGEKLPAPSLSAKAQRWAGRYRPRLSEDELDIPNPFGGDVNVFVEAGRLWAEYEVAPVFGGAKVRVALQPISDTAVRLVGPLADTGPVAYREDDCLGNGPCFRFSGWVFDRVSKSK